MHSRFDQEHVSLTLACDNISDDSELFSAFTELLEVEKPNLVFKSSELKQRLLTRFSTEPKRIFRGNQGLNNLISRSREVILQGVHIDNR